MLTTPEEKTQAVIMTDDPAEAIKRMIAFTKFEAEKYDRTFCAYFLDMAMNALSEDTAEMNMSLKARSTPLHIGLESA